MKFMAKKIKMEFIRVQKPFFLDAMKERKFLNKYGLKGWEFFALHAPPQYRTNGYRIYHFRKPVK